MNNQNKPELKFKILIIGNTAVGKTSMLLKYAENTFPESHMATIGVEFKDKKIETDKYKITLNIWDTAGQERFKSLTRSFFNNTNGIIFVYDITSQASFDGVKNWMKEAEPYGKFESILCGNKVDLAHLRVVKFDTLKEFGLKKKMEVFETSAKNGTHLEDAFRKLVDLIIKSKSHEELINEFEVKTTQTLTWGKSGKGYQNNKNCCIK
jgi:Ras-related protein Rab-1A